MVAMTKYGVYFPEKVALSITTAEGEVIRLQQSVGNHTLLEEQVSQRRIVFDQILAKDILQLEISFEGVKKVPHGHRRAEAPVRYMIDEVFIYSDAEGRLF
jgi:hypothetical protein